MCLFLVVSIFGSQYLENFIEEEIDESMQTAEDYSLCVTDPPDDAVNPDEVRYMILCVHCNIAQTSYSVPKFEAMTSILHKFSLLTVAVLILNFDYTCQWMHFFSRFGTVRYITVTKKNKVLVQTLLQKHLLIRRLQPLEIPQGGERIGAKQSTKISLFCFLNLRILSFAFATLST